MRKMALPRVMGDVVSWLDSGFFRLEDVMANRTFRSFTQLSLVAVACACNGNINRACDFTYADAVLHIQAVTDAQTGAKLGDVVIKNIRYRGVEVTDLRRLVDDIAPLAKGVAVDGQQLRCTVSCAFAADEGEYEFIIARTGYRDFPVALDARYRNVDGDCRRELSGGTEVSVQLVPM
jgi:hypothetical protein